MWCPSFSSSSSSSSPHFLPSYSFSALCCLHPSTAFKLIIKRMLGECQWYHLLVSSLGLWRLILQTRCKKRLETLKFHFSPPPELEEHGDLVAFNEDRIMTVENLTAHVCSGAVKHLELWDVCHYLFSGEIWSGLAQYYFKLMRGVSLNRFVITYKSCWLEKIIGNGQVWIIHLLSANYWQELTFFFKMLLESICIPHTFFFFADVIICCCIH